MDWNSKNKTLNQVQIVLPIFYNISIKIMHIRQ